MANGSNIKDFLLLHSILLVIFYIIYSLAFFFHPSGWNGLGNSHYLFDAFYFTFTTHTTVGFGDIYPKKWYWKGIVTLHIIIVYILMLYGIAGIVSVYAPMARKVKSLSPNRESFSKLFPKKAFLSKPADVSKPFKKIKIPASKASRIRISLSSSK